MSSVRVLVALALSSTLLACGSGGGSGGSSATPLTGEQKGKVQSVNESMSAAQGAATRGDRTNPSFTKPEPTALTKGNSSEKARELGRHLDGTCDFDNTFPSGEASPSNGEYHVRVSGARCPIRMSTNFSYSTKQTAQKIVARFDLDMSYLVQADSFAQLNDVTAIEMKGGFSMIGEQGNASASGKIEGFVQSRAYGRLALSTSVDGGANQKGGTVTLAMAMQFPDFRAVGKMVRRIQDGRETVTYSINDEDVSAEDFQTIMGGLVPPGA